MGIDPVGKNNLTQSDKILGLITVGFGLFVAYNIWGGVFGEMISELLKHSIHIFK